MVLLCVDGSLSGCRLSCVVAVVIADLFFCLLEGWLETFRSGAADFDPQVRFNPRGTFQVVADGVLVPADL